MKKGFTLIEVIVSASLALVIALSIITLYGKVTLNYQEDISEGRDQSSIMEAFLFIQNKLSSKVIDIELIGDKLFIGHSDNVTSEYIFFKPTGNSFGNIQIQYNQLGRAMATNNIITNIKGFNMEKENNIIYISITDKGGRCIKRCLNVKKWKRVTFYYMFY